MKIDFDKSNDGLIPAIIQDAVTKNVLMLGYMNKEALDKTRSTKKITFFSRSKQRLWTKGEESGHYLELVDITIDCDGDTLLVTANPIGPTCHKGTDTCWGATNDSSYGFISQLETIIEQRKALAASDASPSGEENSYVVSLFKNGINKIAQKVGEEAVEVVIEAKDANDDLFLNESADLMFHYLILLRAKGFGLRDIEAVLRKRHP